MSGAADQRAFTAAVEAARALLLAKLAERMGEPAPDVPDIASPADARHALLAERLGLSPFEHWLLLLTAGAEIDPDIRRLCGAWHGDPARDRPSFELALAVHPRAHWSALSPAARLRRFGLIDLERGSGLTGRALIADELVLHHCLGLDALALAVADRLELVAAQPVAEEWQPSVDALASRIAANPAAPIEIAGAPGSARAIAVAAAGGRPVYRPRPDARLAADDPLIARLLRVERGVLLVEQPEQAALLAPHPVPVLLIGAAGTRGELRVPAAPVSPPRTSGHDLGDGLAGLAIPIEPRSRWEDLILPEAERAQLARLIDQVRHRATVVETWGFGAKTSRGLGLSALFAGPSGTGKTMASEIVAGALGHALYRVDLAAIVSKYIGETEKHLDRLFRAAEHQPVLLLFDEADALFGKRGAVRDGLDRFANQEVSFLLQRIESFEGVAILTTNLPDAIDPAFVRRFRFLVNFPFPDHGRRVAIWRSVLPEALPAEPLDLNRLGRIPLSGGAIRNVALNGAYLAAAGGTRLGMDHLMQAAEAELAKVNQRLRPEMMQ